MATKLDLEGMKEKFFKLGFSEDFILTGIVYYKSYRDSKIEFYCLKDKVFVVRNWERWQGCFSHHNTKESPYCCCIRMGKRFGHLSNKDSVSDKSFFPTGEATVLLHSGGFSQEEKQQIVTKIASEKRSVLTNPSVPEQEIISIPVKNTSPPLDDEGRMRYIKENAKRIKATIIKIEGLKTKSLIYMRCGLCGKDNSGSQLRTLGIMQNLRCCSGVSKRIGMSDALSEALFNRGHQIVGPFPVSRFDSFKVYCLKHNYLQNTCRNSYEKSICGLSCCATSRIVEGRLEQRVLTEESRKRRGLPVTDSDLARRGIKKWRAKVFGNEPVCFLTGSSQNLEAHHLFSVNGYPSLATKPLNGVVIERGLHRHFHTWHGVRDPCTPGDLCSYLSFISDKNNTEGKVFFDSIRDLQLVDPEIKLQELRAIEKTLTGLL